MVLVWGVGGSILARLQASKLRLYQRMGYFAGVFRGFCLDFENPFFPEQL